MADLMRLFRRDIEHDPEPEHVIDYGDEQALVESIRPAMTQVEMDIDAVAKHLEKLNHDEKLLVAQIAEKTERLRQVRVAHDAFSAAAEILYAGRQ